ncbi:hypothetical protein HDU98_011391 [Podochytrium sp. JEL0797]|nr:hypothetical protein HDU98_011391 [Podochytrium sp. JEL0797]
MAVAIGFAAIYQNKVNKGKKHFQTYHGIAGLVVFLLVITITSFGIAMHYFPAESFGSLSKSKRWATVKRTGGRVLLVLSWITASLGLISHSTVERISLVGRLFIFSVMAGCVALSFWNPVARALSASKEDDDGEVGGGEYSQVME